ncbi:MAG TPA: Tol-Pal system beta propeller repeat protein TolB [Desulfatiglandales bacterium]|nr:Tol-Pal system beta propeller repeat protein TolB [Desulfatiglandales bacterium]
MLKLILVLKILFNSRAAFQTLIFTLALWGCIIFQNKHAEGRLYVDITSPSMRKIAIAIPDFKRVGNKNEYPDFSSQLADIISNDFDLSGYFQPLDKQSFIESPNAGITRETIHFNDWSVIGAALLLKGGYECVGKQLKVEVRLFDVFSGKQLYGKRASGDVEQSRYLMHRLGNDILNALIGHEGPFLTKMAFVGTSTGHKEIYMSDYDGHDMEQITHFNNITLSPRLSTKGDMLIYTSFQDSGTVLFIHDLIKKSYTKISDRKGLNISAAWKPGGKEIALTLTISGNPDIYLIDTTGKILQRLTNNWGIDVSPSFSPDGKKMAFVSNRSGSPQIYILDLITNKVERLTFEGTYNTSPSWSNLDRIAFSGSSNGRFDIFTISPDGKDLQRLTQDQGDNEDPRWSPDGRYIAFASNRNGGNYHILIANASGANQKQVTFFNGDQLSPFWFQNLR